LQNHPKHHREKVQGEGRLVPLDREAKERILAKAKALSHPTEKGKHYGVLTDKHLAVLRVLLFGFHNAHSGRCFPSYEAIAKAAHCSRTTVNAAIKALEDAGLMTWVNRYVLIAAVVCGVDLLGNPAKGEPYPQRISNQYEFIDPNSHKSKTNPGTPNQLSILSVASPKKPDLAPPNPLHAASAGFEARIRAK
jgi:Helix-turn-helix domain